MALSHLILRGKRGRERGKTSTVNVDESSEHCCGRFNKLQFNFFLFLGSLACMTLHNCVFWIIINIFWGGRVVTCTQMCAFFGSGGAGLLLLLCTCAVKATDVDNVLPVMPQHPVRPL